MRYSADEMEILEQNPYIRIVSPLTFVMEDSLYKSLFEEWMQDKRGATIEAGLVQRGIPEGMISDRYIAAVVWSFQGTNGYLRDRDIKSKANDVALVASGLFTTRREQVAWNPEFKKSLLDHYPKETFEDGILKAGLIPETLGNQRMASLRHAYKVRMDREGRFCDQDACKSNVPIQTCPDNPAGDAWQYGSHPYVSGVSGNRSLTMTAVFFNEANVLEGLSVQEILQLYEIDPANVGRNCISEIRMKLITWEKTDEVQEEWDEQVLRIQQRRLSILISQTEKSFARIRSEAGRLRPLQKKQLCRQLSEYPTRTEYPYGYSLRHILAKAGISKTVYYKALYDEEYGRSEERREERDKADLEKVVRVMEYKGFEKCWPKSHLF